MRNKINTKTLTMISMAVAINVVGAFIAYSIKLPIYLDSVGTVLIASLFGSKYAVITGVCSSIVSGMTFDSYSIFFAPVQITTGYFAGLMYKKKMLEGIKVPIGTFIFALPTAIISAVIAAFVFGGVTSAGSSYIVQILSSMGIPMVVCVFIIQIITDYMDELVGVMIVAACIKVLPSTLKNNTSDRKINLEKEVSHG